MNLETQLKFATGAKEPEKKKGRLLHADNEQPHYTHPLSVITMIKLQKFK